MPPSVPHDPARRSTWPVPGPYNQGPLYGSDTWRQDRPERIPRSNVAISLDRGCLLRGGREIRLRAKTFQVLVYLHEHHGRLVAKEDLFRAVWPDTFVSDDSLTKCVREIRDALGDHDHQLLKTVARRGFILDAPLATVPSASARHTSAHVSHPNARTHNLPAPLTSFIGRQREIAELARLLPSTRLLTLTGAGGCGKTRLALEVARQVLDGFPDGVWLADLAPLAEPTLVAHTVASVLDVRQAPNRSLVETLSDQLRNRRLLLVLDNCEHVIAHERRARRDAAPRRGRPDDPRHEPRGTGDRRRDDVASAVAHAARPAALRPSPTISCSTRPSVCWSSALRPLIPGSRSRATTPAPSPRCAGGSTGSRWRSSWRRRG